MRLIKPLENVHLVLDNLIVALENLLADDLDRDIDGRIGSLPESGPYNTKGAFAESLVELIVLLLDCKCQESVVRRRFNERSCL